MNIYGYSSRYHRIICHDGARQSTYPASRNKSTHRYTKRCLGSGSEDSDRVVLFYKMHMETPEETHEQGNITPDQHHKNMEKILT